MNKKTMHYGWVICFGCTIVIICTMGLAANAGFSVFLPYIKECGGYTDMEISMIITIRSVFMLIGTFIVTQFYEKMDIRIGLTIVLCIVAMAFVCYAMAESLWMYYLGAILAGTGYGLGTLIPVSILINRWFIEKRALAIGICASGTGIATLCCPGILTRTIEKFGVQRAFISVAFFVLIVAVFTFLVLRNDPQKSGRRPYGETPEAEEKKERKVVAVRKLQLKEWIFLLAAMVCMGAVAILGTSNMSLLYRAAGQDSYMVAKAISLFGIMLIIAKLVFGSVLDKIGAYLSNYIFSVLAILGLFISCTVEKTGTAGMFSSIIFMGFGMALATIGLPIWAADFSTEETYVTILKRLQLAYQLGGLVFAPVCGAIAGATGNYIAIYFMFAVFMLITVVTVQAMYRRLGAKM